jgi:hypothetical protein
MMSTGEIRELTGRQVLGRAEVEIPEHHVPALLAMSPAARREYFGCVKRGLDCQTAMACAEGIERNKMWRKR